ncbi:winged helix-turn-helix transcriptional regulator [Nonomuraea sp. NPDC059194]|uniref:winged helix-turn-helix transcriptional regulator n=1 Tax=Nonomuraea sp. NPDC059194 TaxID=3346764 RepID=UPI003697A6FE
MAASRASAGKWAIQIIVASAGEPIRFTELERLIQGISRRMLTLTLRNLERDGMLTRTVYPIVPPKVEYQAMLALTDWSRRQRVRGQVERALRR